MILTSKGTTDAGCVRQENQDRIICDDSLGLYAVCDGLGGRRRGDVAAEIAVSAIRQYVESSGDPLDVTWPFGYNLQLSFAANRILTATKLANRQIWRKSEESLALLGMGTTICAVLMDAHSAAVANIGDSRVYLFRNGVLEQLTIDDTISGGASLTRETMIGVAPSMIRSILTRSAGSEEVADAHLRECNLENGDVFLLCSDGLHGCVSDDRIAALLAAAQPSVVEAAGPLIEEARAAGGPDNVSAVVIQYFSHKA